MVHSYSQAYASSDNFERIWLLEAWTILDNKRDPINPVEKFLTIVFCWWWSWYRFFKWLLKLELA